MASSIGSLAPGQVSTNSDLESDLGNVYFLGNKAYRLVKAAADIASAENKILTTALSSGVPTWSVNTSTTAADAHVAGIVPSGIDTISSTAGQLDEGDYFLLQVSGPATAIAAGTGIADNGLIGTSTVAGSVDDAGVTAGVSAAGRANQASTAASQEIAVELRGLV